MIVSPMLLLPLGFCAVICKSKADLRPFPIMPYNTYHFMSDADVADLVSYLRTVPALPNRVPARQMKVPVPPPPALPPSPATAPASGVERGRYLVEAVSDCVGCHTPQTPEGAPDTTRLLAGAPIPRAEGRYEIAPNITPDKKTGIGSWTEEQIMTLLKTGKRPAGSAVGGLMAAVIDAGFSQLTDADARAIASFLKAVPAVSNVPKAP